MVIENETFVFWKNLLLVSVFFVVTPLVIGISVFSLFSIKATNLLDQQLRISSGNPMSGVRVFASLPAIIPSVSGNALSQDARPEILKNYFSYYKSPLISQAQLLVDTADKYELDFRLLPAIAQQESNLCKIIPPNTFNCWGWGIHSKGTLGFDSYEEAIETVSQGIKEEYIDKGYLTPEEIMSKYTPMSNGSWARGVTQFMGEME
jgi:hypothetical protein